MATYYDELRAHGRHATDAAIARARPFARKVFAKRGNHSEAHITEAELIALLALFLVVAQQDTECSECGEVFTPAQPTDRWCSDDCMSNAADRALEN